MAARTLAATAVLALLALGAGLRSAQAGGTLDTLDLGRARTVDAAEGMQAAPVISIRSDSRCIAVPYTINVSQPVLPNPLGDPFLTVAQARAALERSMTEWRNVPVSFIDMRIVGETQSTKPSGFDFVNELTFIVDTSMPGGFLGVSPSMTLMQRTEFKAGMDVDMDGDSDVSAGIALCADTDGDGDIEFPTGTYEAGTILDNDVIFNALEARFTTADDALDTVRESVDLQSIATHELGHSHGLSHSLVTQRGPQDGRAATMFPFIDTGDPDAERTQRVPDPDGILVSARLYPEGSQRQGIAALQRGDVRPRTAFGEISGRVSDADGNSVAGANVFCRDVRSGRLAGSAFSGAVQLAIDPDTDEILVLDDLDSVINGDFRLLLPPGRYECGVEPADGSPVPADSVNLTAITADILGQASFAEEFFNGAGEAAFELNPGAARTVQVRSGRLTPGVSFKVSPELILSSSGERGEGLRAIAGAPGAITAVVIPGVWLLEMDKAVKAELGDSAVLAIPRAEFRSIPALSTEVPRFRAASVNRCSLTVNAGDLGLVLDIDTAKPLRIQRDFTAQDDDYAPLFLERSDELGREVLAGLRSGAFKDVCLLLQFPEGPFTNPSGQPPGLITDSMAGLRGLSFTSLDGGRSFQRLDRNLQFSLGLTVLTPENAPQP